MPAGRLKRKEWEETSSCKRCMQPRKCSLLCALGKVSQALIVLSSTGATSFYGFYLLSTLEVEEWGNKIATYILFFPSVYFYIFVGVATVWCTDGRQLAQIFAYDYAPLILTGAWTYLTCLTQSMFILAYLDDSLNNYSYLKYAFVVFNPLIPICTYVTASNMNPNYMPREFGFLWWLFLCVSATGFAYTNLNVPNRITFFLTLCFMSLVNFSLLVGLLWEGKVKRLFDIETRGRELYRILVVFRCMGYVISFLRQGLVLFFCLALYTSDIDYISLSFLSFYCIGGLIMYVVLANSYSQFSIRKKYHSYFFK